MTGQLLWHRVRVTVPDEPAARAVGLLRQGAAHGFEPTAAIDLEVRAADAGYRVFDNGDLLAEADSPRRVLDTVFERVHRRAFELASLKGWVRFHGAVVRTGGRRVVLSGPSGSGKSTLAVAALLTGGTVEGDESFLSRDGQVVAVPRRWHLRASSLRHFPDAGWLREAPVLDGDPPLHLVDPTEHGFTWPLPIAPIDALVVLGGPGASLRADGLSGPEVVRHLVGEAFPVTEARADVLRQASALARSAPAVALDRGPAPPGEVLRTIARLPGAG